MNVLVNKLPTKIKVDGQIYEINADFRNCIKIMLAYEDDSLTQLEKHLIMLELLYKEVPPNLEQAVEKGVKFLNCGGEISKEESSRLYSFKKDANYIYSAVSKAGGIDLETVNFFHWWKFCFYFLEISPDSTIANIMNLRQKAQSGKLTKEEKTEYIKARKILDLDYEEEPEESKFMQIFNSGGD